MNNRLIWFVEKFLKKYPDKVFESGVLPITKSGYQLF